MSRKKEFNAKYSPEYKIAVIMDMRENHLSYREAARKYWAGEREDNYKNWLKEWERVYLTEGAVGFMTERRGRKSTGRPRKRPLDKEIENDLIAENQRLKKHNQYLEAELEYIKKTKRLSSCGRAKERQKAEIISELRQTFPLGILLQISRIPRSTYYYHHKQSRSDKYLLEKCEIKALFEANKQRYGYRRIT